MFETKISNDLEHYLNKPIGWRDTVVVWHIIKYLNGDSWKGLAHLSPIRDVGEPLALPVEQPKFYDLECFVYTDYSKY